MSKKVSIISLIVLTLVGALSAVLSVNMFASDVGNMGAGGAASMLITAPAALITCMLAAAILYVLRAYKRPTMMKKLSKTYLIIFAVVSGVGVLTSILGGIVVYGSLASSQPFPGYNIIFMVLHFLLLAGSIVSLVMINKQFPDDSEVFKMKVSHVFATIGWFLFLLLMLDRFGMFLTMPFYVYLRTLYMTFPFYLFLLVPVFLGVIKCFNIFEIVNKKTSMVLSIIALSLAVILFVVVIVIGMNNTSFISAVSQAMPFERLLSMPMEILVHIISYLAVGTILLVQSLKK